MAGEIWMQPRRSLPMNGLMIPEGFGPAGMRALPPHPFHAFEMPNQIILDKQISNQNGEMEKLAAENQRLASTHGTLRRELAASQHELQMLQTEIGSIRSEREQRLGGLMEKMGKLESDLQTSDSLHLQLQQARADAQGLAVARQELLSTVQLMTQDLQRAHFDSQQIPALISELDGLRQEYQNCRSTYDYEKKAYNDHIDSLQLMEKKYVTMAREVEKLRAELTNSTGIERRSGGGSFGHGEERAMNQTNQNHASYEDDYKGRGGSHQGGGSFVSGQFGGGQQPSPAAAAAAAAQGRVGYESSGRGSGFDNQRVASSGFEGQRGGSGFDMQRGGFYDPQQHISSHTNVPTSAAPGVGYPMVGPGPPNVAIPHVSANPRPSATRNPPPQSR